MHFEPTVEQAALRDTVRRFVAENVIPKARAWDKAESFPKDAVERVAAMGLLGINTPVSLGGSGLSMFETALIIEELARGDGSLALMVASHNGLCLGHILKAGTEAQKQRFVPPLAQGRCLGAWALTEPNSGSDAKDMATVAHKDAEGWILSGSKVFITQGTVATTYVVLASTDKSLGTRGITAFIVPADTHGFSKAPLKDKLGMRGSDTAILNFDGCRLAQDAQLGALGAGFADTLSILDHGRITIGALAVGLARGALEEARKYSLERKQFNRPISDFQAIQWKLADMATELDAARLLVWRAAWLCDQKQRFGEQASMAKLMASEVAVKACDEAVQIHGGYGYTSEFPVERYWRDAKLCTIGEGTSEIQRMVIARSILSDALA